MVSLKYRVGIDVGTFSVGLAAIEVDEKDMPVKILSAVSHIHDSGLDPDQIKSAVTRLASSGIARRTRRLYRRKRRRLVQLDKFIEGLGWPVKEFEEYNDPFMPWHARAELAAGFIEDEAERNEKLSIAMRHIARHRGWRNPYSKVSTLHTEAAPSEAFLAIKEEIAKAAGIKIPEDITVGQLVAFCNLGKHRLRGEGGVLSSRLLQSDHANEIIAIGRMQNLDSLLVKQLIDEVFKAESPKGSASGRTGVDPLQPSKKRALKATEEFQRYRIASLIGNLRIREGSGQRRLTKEETALVFDHLINLKPKSEPSWLAVCEILGIDRGNLRGTATMTDDGERAGAAPPVHETTRRILNCKVKPLVAWWMEANAEDRYAMIKALANSEVDDFDSQSGAKVQAFFAELSDEDNLKLDSLHLPMGRAAYCEDTLTRITKRILENGEDLYEARLHEFQIPVDWTPPAPEIGAPVGNPAVDRVLKAVSRWLETAVDAWGAPTHITIEHVRDAFTSERKSREIDRDQQRRAKRNYDVFAEMEKTLGVQNRNRSDLTRYLAVQRQNGQCAYCGTPISYQGEGKDNFEMDHIVPQAGPGSTNKRENLVAVCPSCNRSKGNVPFAVWAAKSTNPNISVKAAVERTRHWLADPGLNAKKFARFRNDVCDRLSRVSIDEEIDARSIESVAWMANELRGRIAQRFAKDGTKVAVYRGELTAKARGASGISKRLEFLDGYGKTRFDRRHHAVDAAVITFITPTIATILAQRDSMRDSQNLLREPAQWKEFTGLEEKDRYVWTRWKIQMEKLSVLLNEALTNDRIVVMSNLRLRLGNGSAHEDTIGKLTKLHVGDALSVATIDRAASEALWCALTRHPDFDPKEGLPADPSRQIRIHGTRLGATDEIGFFPVNAGCIALNGGYVELGSSFHHARIYKITSGKKPAYAMMRVYTVDLLPYRNQDLFTAEIKPQTMTMRQCEPKLRRAIAEGNAEYLGWLVVDDELLIDPSPFSDGQVGNAQQELGPIRRWRVDGFFTETRLRLRPTQMSAEGLHKRSPNGDKVSRFGPDVGKVVDRPGWVPAVNKLFANGKVTVVRRDALGRPRITSPAHLPISWKVE